MSAASARIGGFWLSAAAIWIGFAVSDVCGLRRYVPALSGMQVAPSEATALSLCLLYVALYFGSTVLAPILLLAGAIDRMLARVSVPPGRN